MVKAASQVTEMQIVITQNDDYTVIPVRVFLNSELSHSIEEGIFTDCQHLETKNGFCINDNCGEFVD